MEVTAVTFIGRGKLLIFMGFFVGEEELTEVSGAD
jgi:hypothetical protein